MNKILLLVKLQLKGSLNIKKMFYMREDKNTSRIILTLLAMFLPFLFGGMSGVYAYLYATMLKPMGALETIPAMWMALTCFMTLFTTMFKVKGTLFQFSDYDMIMSMPVSTTGIVASRIIVLYLYNIIFTFIIVLPGNIVYGVFAGAGASFYFLSTLLAFFIPLVPILFGTLLGLMITIVSSKFKYKNFVTIALFILLFAAYMVIMMKSATAENPEQAMTTMANYILDQVYKIYPLTSMYVAGILHLEFLSLLGFVGISTIVFAVFCNVVGNTFKKINTMVGASKSKSNYKVTELNSNSVLMSLYKREMKRFFSAPMYVLNSAAGIFLMTIASVVYVVMGKDELVKMLEMPALADSLTSYIPILLLFCTGMTCTTAASISLEGKRLWILQSIPIEPKTIFLGKALVNISVASSLSIINAIIYGIGLRMSPLLFVISLVLPCVASVFMAFLGLVFNLKFPRFDWKNEMEVVKQGMPTMLALITGMLIGAAPIGGIMLFPQVKIEYLYIAYFLVLSILTIGIYKYLSKRGSIAFARL